MYHFIYSRPLWLIIIAMIAAVLIWAYLVARKPRGWKAINTILAVLSLLAILAITLLRHPAEGAGVCLIPFHAFAEAKHQPELYREMLMNVFLFLPLGLTLPNILPTKSGNAIRIALTVIFGLLLSVGIEYLQYRYALGTAEVDDAICNTAGAWIGAGHLAISRYITKHRSN